MPLAAPIWSVHGYAIVCARGCIADANGILPKSLMNDADWQYFQAELDRADITVLGRTSHEAAPNPKNRMRVVMTRAGNGLTRGADAWLWNPVDLPAPDMLAALLPTGGRVAVPGGRGPFDLFLSHGYAGFHLSRKAGVALAGGVPVFSADGAPEDILTAAGLIPGPVQAIDPEDGVTLTVWTPPQDSTA
ncbi:MAG: hypothetical protein ACJAVR_000625 [Paracoccaceae bacterium]|jgi:hypothetical protein